MIFSLFGRGRLFEGGVYFKNRDLRGFIRGGVYSRRGVYSRKYGSRKSMIKFAVTDEKYSVSIRLLTVKYNSHADMRTGFWKKGFQHEEEDSKNKITI